MPNGDIYQLNAHHALQLNENVYTIYLRLATSADESAIVSELRDWCSNTWMTQLLPVHVSAWMLRCFEFYRIYPDRTVPEVEIVNQTGSRTTTSPLPGQCSLVATLYGDVVDTQKYNTGRDYWYGADSADQANGSWDKAPGDYMNDITNVYNNLGVQITPVSGNVYEIGVLSKSRLWPPKVGEPPVQPPPVVPYFWQLQRVRVKQLVRTQRRRQPLDPCEYFEQLDL